MSDAESLAAKLAVLKEYGLLDRVGEVDGVKLFAPLLSPTEREPMEQHKDQERRRARQDKWERDVANGQVGRWIDREMETSPNVPPVVRNAIREARQAERAAQGGSE